MGLPLMQALTDNFSGSSLDTAKWTVVNGTADVSGGQLVMPCTSGYTTVQSVDPYDMTGSYAFAKITPDQGGSGYEAPLYVGAIDGSTGYILGYEEGNLAAAFDVDFSYTFIGTTPYDPLAHAWVKISESGGTLTYSASPDGRTWTDLWTSDEHVIAVTEMYAQLYTGHFLDGPDGTSFGAHFNVTAGPAMLPFLPAVML